MPEALIGMIRPRSVFSRLTDPDTTAFLSDKFDVQDYAEAVLQGRTYRPDEEAPLDKGKGRLTDVQGDRGDVGVELARLNQGIVRDHSHKSARCRS